MPSRAIAAALTPHRDDGAALDEDVFAPYAAFLEDGGIDGILALGTTGEGILLSVAERKRVVELFVAGPLPVIAHAGALRSAPGIIAISGTGSVVFGVNEAGRRLRNYDFRHYARSAARHLA